MSDIKLSSPRYAVVLGDPADPETWQKLDSVQVLSVDLMRAELVMQRGKQKPTELPIRFGAIGVWAALTRLKVIAGDFDAFTAQLVDLEGIEQTVAGPTPPALEAG